MSLRGCSYEECKDIQEWDHEVILRVCGSISDHIHAHGDHGNRAQSIQSLPSAISSTDTCVSMIISRLQWVIVNL